MVLSVKRLLQEYRSSRLSAACTWEALQRFVRQVPTHAREPAQELAFLAMRMLGFERGALPALAREYEEWWQCLDCGGYPDDYLVFRSTWKEANMQPRGGFLCVGCLERRLGRQLTSLDFPRTGEELRLNRRTIARSPKSFSNNLFWRAYELGRTEGKEDRPPMAGCPLPSHKEAE